MGALRKTHATHHHRASHSSPARRPLRSFRVRQAAGYLAHLRHRYHRKLTASGPLFTKYLAYPTLVAGITAALGFRGNALVGAALAKAVLHWWGIVVVANALAAYILLSVEELFVALRIHKRVLRSLDALRREAELELRVEYKTQIAFSTLTGILYLAWAGLLVAN